MPSHITVRPILFLAASLVLLIGLSTSATAQPGQCTLKQADLPAAPELLGFHLGMTALQAKARVPQIAFGKVDAIGISKTTINPGFDPRMDQQAFANVRSISLEFLDEKVSSVWLGYEDSFKWHTVDDFVAGISQSLRLPDAWESWRSRGKRIRCADFQIVVSTLAGGASFQLTDETAAQTIADRRATQAEEQEAAEQAAAEVVGDKRNKVYYLARCLVGHPLAEKDRVVFKTKVEAEAAGYKPATDCE